MTPSPETALPTDLFADLDRNGPIPLYFQISSRLEEAITRGALPAGARLQNEIDMAAQLGLSRPTMRRAIQELVDKGLLVRQRGIGTQVVHGPNPSKVGLSSLYEDLANTHRNPGTIVLERHVVPAPEFVAAALGVGEGTEVLFLRRKRSADGVPVAIMANHLPISFADVTAEQLERNGLYQTLRARGTNIRVAKQRISARIATEEESAILDIESPAAVLTLERVSFDNAGRAIELGTHCYRPDQYSFDSTVVAR